MIRIKMVFSKLLIPKKIVKMNINNSKTLNKCGLTVNITFQKTTKKLVFIHIKSIKVKQLSK